jgi:hypothetical protein
MHNVKYARSAGVRLYATEPERMAGVELRTSTMTQVRPDGTHIPFEVRSSHYWMDGVVIRRARDPILPSSSSVSSALRKVVLRTARLALQCGGWGCHTDGKGPAYPNRSDDVVAPNKGGSQPAPKGGRTSSPDTVQQATAKRWTHSLLRFYHLQCRSLHPSSSRRYRPRGIPRL